MESYIETLAQSLPLEYLVSIISLLPPVKHLEYAINSNNKDLVLLIVDNMDISIKNIEVEEYEVKKMVSKNFYDDSDILLQLFNYDYDLYCRLIHRCNYNMIPIKLTDIWYGEKVDGISPSFALMDNMDMLKPVFDKICIEKICIEKIQYSEKIMQELYNAIIHRSDNRQINEYIYFQTIKIFPQEFMNFLNDNKYYDYYTDTALPRTIEYLHRFRIGKYSDCMSEDILSKIFDGTLIIPKHLIYCEVFSLISEKKMYYIVKKYKPTCKIPIQDIFNWYCYKNAPYRQYIVKHYKVEIPTFDTFLRCYHRVNYYYDQDKDDDYYNKKVSKMYEPVKKYLFSLGGMIKMWCAQFKSADRTFELSQPALIEKVTDRTCGLSSTQMNLVNILK